jgi:hypothetical protein
MTREQAVKILDDLFGLRTDYVEWIVGKLGYDALTDEALVCMARQQSADERSAGERAERETARRMQRAAR